MFDSFSRQRSQQTRLHVVTVAPLLRQLAASLSNCPPITGLLAHTALCRSSQLELQFQDLCWILHHTNMLIRGSTAEHDDSSATSWNLLPHLVCLSAVVGFYEPDARPPTSDLRPLTSDLRPPTSEPLTSPETLQLHQCVSDAAERERERIKLTLHICEILTWWWRYRGSADIYIFNFSAV